MSDIFRKKMRRATPRSKAPAPDTATELVDEVDEAAVRRLLDQIAEGAGICAQIEADLAQHPAPALDTLMKLQQFQILKLSLKTRPTPESRKQLVDLLRAVLEWARLSEKRKERELAEQKYRDQIGAQKALSQKVPGDNALTPETLALIERELNLL